MCGARVWIEVSSAAYSIVLEHKMGGFVDYIQRIYSRGFGFVFNNFNTIVFDFGMLFVMVLGYSLYRVGLISQIFEICF